MTTQFSPTQVYCTHTHTHFRVHLINYILQKSPLNYYYYYHHLGNLLKWSDLVKGNLIQSMPLHNVYTHLSSSLSLGKRVLCSFIIALFILLYLKKVSLVPVNSLYSLSYYTGGILHPYTIYLAHFNKTPHIWTG